jgi:hypothetical protein
MSRIDLERVREWANAKLSGSKASPRAEHQYLKLRETVDALLAKVDCPRCQSAIVPPETPYRKAHLRLVWSRDSPNQVNNVDFARAAVSSAFANAGHEPVFEVKILGSAVAVPACDRFQSAMC